MTGRELPAASDRMKSIFTLTFFCFLSAFFALLVRVSLTVPLPPVIAPLPVAILIAFLPRASFLAVAAFSVAVPEAAQSSSHITVNGMPLAIALAIFRPPARTVPFGAVVSGAGPGGFGGPTGVSAAATVSSLTAVVAAPSSSVTRRRTVCCPAANVRLTVASVPSSNF